MGRGIITASRTACLRAEHEVASRGEKCARLFSVGSEIAKNRFRDPTHSSPDALPRYAEHKLLLFGQLRPGGFKGGYATTYCGCLAAPIGVLCLVVYRVDLLRRSVWSASVTGSVECWFGSRFGEARIG